MALPIPTGSTPRLLSRDTRRLAIRAWYAAQGSDLLASHWVNQAISSLRASDSALKPIHQSFSIINSFPLGPPEPPIFLTVILTSLDVISSRSTLGRDA